VSVARITDASQPAFSYTYSLAVTVPGSTSLGCGVWLCCPPGHVVDFAAESDQLVVASGGAVKLIARSTFDGSIAVRSCACGVEAS
jgi:hypothetical protein